MATFVVEQNYKILGFNDDECTCHVCGKEELKGTYAIENLSTGEIIRAGSTCGAKMAGWTRKEFVKKEKQAEKENYERAMNEFRNSPEYLAKKSASKFLDNERKELERKVLSTNDPKERGAIMSTKRSTISCFEFLSPYEEAVKLKKLAIWSAYGLPENTYLG